MKNETYMLNILCHGDENLQSNNFSCLVSCNSRKGDRIIQLKAENCWSQFCVKENLSFLETFFPVNFTI